MRKITNDEAIERLSINNSNVIILDQYYSSEEKSNFKCIVCDYEWKANARGVINGKNGCPECGRKIARETIKYNISTNDFKKKIKKIFDDKLSIIGEYTNVKSKIEVKCNICSYVWISNPINLIKGYGCNKCGHVEKGKKQRKSNDIFNNEILSIYGDKLTLLSKYNTGKDRINVKCNICNHEWNPVSRRLLNRGCPKCNFSKGELLISNILNEIKINFKSQYIFEGLKTEINGTPIFDFIIFDELNNIKCVIEYDGLQHFKSVKRWGGEARLKRQYEIDEFKNNYCYNSNIKIIRIPYTELKKINKEYIINLL